MPWKIWPITCINDAEVQIERTISVDVPEENMPNNAFYPNYQHFLLLHSETRFHTQAIEQAWVETKAYMRRASPLLQSHVDEVSWSNSRKSYENGLFIAFLQDILYRGADVNLETRT